RDVDDPIGFAEFALGIYFLQIRGIFYIYGKRDSEDNDIIKCKMVGRIFSVPFILGLVILITKFLTEVLFRR
ncbi:hypothetical protein KAJ26_03290, partial [bacterium]|nr:hypothetical protein [bacterium]